MKRNEQLVENTWNLEKIFKDRADFDKSSLKALKLAKKIARFKGKLSNEDNLLESLKLYDELGIESEKIASYAYMKNSEDGTNTNNMELMNSYIALSTKVGELIAFFISEISAQDIDYLKSFTKRKDGRDYRVFINRIIRDKKHILSEKEERLLSWEDEVGSVFSRCFDDLTDVDFDFGSVRDKKLTHASYSSFLQNDDITVRKEAYYAYYKKYDETKSAISKMYEGALRQSAFKAKARGFKSTLAKSLYADNVNESVFKNLIDVAHSATSILERYYNLKKKALKQDKLYHYDVYMPLVKDYKTNIPYEKAVETVINALSVLGKEYTDVLERGLTCERWVDRYENEGKASGAYSNGCYKTLPYILMSYKDDVLRDVFTLAHEGGHSMHSYYSARNNPFSSYNYSIFEAEVASTFNENVLYTYMIKNAKDEREKLYLETKRADDIVATFFRQTMFTEYEYIMHKRLNEGQSITLNDMRKTYKGLLDLYLPGVTTDDTATLEALRIPHFYRPFYVYKYATGISAAVALSERVMNGGEKERNDYLSFLKSGGSHFPLDSLKKAGVDLKKKENFEYIVTLFEQIVSNLEDAFEQYN